MSMLYKSLQKLRRQDQAKVPVPSFAAEYVGGSARKRFLRAGLISLIMVGLLTVFGFYIKARLEHYLETTKSSEKIHTAAQDSSAAFETVDEHGLVIVDERADESLETEEPASASQAGDSAVQLSEYNELFKETKRYIPQTKLEQQLDQGSSEVKSDRARLSGLQESADLSGTDNELERHFSSRAERNRRAMALNKDIEAAFASGDEEALHGALTRLREVLSPQSVLVLKWEGVLAMQSQDFDLSREKFSEVLKKSPEDQVTQANMALVLIKLGRVEQARKVFEDLRIQAPESPMVQTLSNMLR